MTSSILRRPSAVSSGNDHQDEDYDHHTKQPSQAEGSPSKHRRYHHLPTSLRTNNVLLHHAGNGLDWNRRSMVASAYPKHYPQWIFRIILLASLFFIAWLLHHQLGSSSHAKNEPSYTARSMRPPSRDDMPPSAPIFTDHSIKASPGRRFQHPSPLEPKEEKERYRKDYGGLEIWTLDKRERSRTIFQDPLEDEGVVYEVPEVIDDLFDVYMGDKFYGDAIDDDYIRSPYYRYDDDTIQDEKLCRRVSWHRLQFPTCNTFHEEIMTMDNIPSYLSDGFYRDAFVVKQNLNNTITQKFIFKQSKYDHEYSPRHYSFVRMDALIPERLSSSPRIVNVYGHCGTAVLNEFIPGGELKSIALKQKKKKISSKQKLRYALEMAEGLATLHGFVGGVIVHGDLHLGQFLLAEDGTMKMGDFNRAEIMLWDEENQEYCKYRSNLWNTYLRAPEEYAKVPFDEKIDVYSFGAYVYVVLRGSWPHYDNIGNDDSRKAKKLLSKGVKPFELDEKYRKRSAEEGKLIQIIERCMEFDPDKRPSMFEVVEFLRKAVHDIGG